MNSCHAIRDDLAASLERSECVRSGKSAQECLRNHMNELPEDCQALYKSYVHCRRGLLDMRKRFRGNAPFVAAQGRAPGGTSSVDTAASASETTAKDADPAQNIRPDRLA